MKEILIKNSYPFKFIVKIMKIRITKHKRGNKIDKNLKTDTSKDTWMVLTLNKSRNRFANFLGKLR